jgi:PAS domain S-box-containing protein
MAKDNDSKFLDPADLKRVETDSREKSRQLDQRIKELSCLYGFSQLIETENLSLDDICNGLVNLIPSAWQNSEFTCARLVYGGHEFSTANYKETRLQQSIDIIVAGSKTGTLSVGCLDERPEAGKSPFLKEELQLLHALGQRLGRVIERKNMENSLQTFRNRLNFAFQAAHIGAWELDLIDHTAWRSLKHDEIFGYKALLPNWTFEMFIDHVVPEDREQVKEKFQNALSTKNFWDFECRIKRNDHEVRWIWAKGEPRYDNQGNPQKMWGIVQDITERKIIEIELLESKAQLDLALQSSQLGVWSWNLPENKRCFDGQTCRILGIDPSTFHGSQEEFFRIVHPEDREILSGMLRKSIEQDVLYNPEYRVVWPGGEIHWVSARGKLMRDGNQKPLRILGVLWDITDKKRAEQALLNAQKLESLGVLAGGIAHDFNNLLGGLFGYIDLANEGTKESTVSRYLAKALGTIDRARALTLQLLTFAKGGAPIRKIEPMVPFVQETAQFALSGSTVSCDFRIPENLWLCDIDKNQIGQVIDNIIINAQQAMPSGGKIEVSAQNISLSEKQHATLAAGNYVELAIKDQGIGIPKEFLPRIFDPFYTTKPKGHGLGLSTCYSIVHRHGGCIEVDSEPGKGSTFHVYLPASADSAAAAAKEPTTNFKGSGTFLVMDDEEVMRETIGTMLESLGYSVVLKTSGEDAIAWFAKETKAKRTLAGMIFDLTIPGGMGGREAIGEIRKLCLKTPVFVASGYAEDPVMSNPGDHGFSASICKPFIKAELIKMLDENMKKLRNYRKKLRHDNNL